MNYLLKKVGTKSIINFLRMKPATFRDELDALTGVKYSLHSTNKSTSASQLKTQTNKASCGKINKITFRDQLDFLSGIRYGFSAIKNITSNTIQKGKQVEGKEQKKKKDRDNNDEKTNANPKGKNQGNQKALNFQIKTPKGTRDYYPHQMAIRRKVIDSIVEVFKKHGGVEIDTPVFELKQVLTGKYGQDSKLIYDLQDQGGQKCSLRYDLTVPFARFMANNTNIQKIKRFHIGKVYRRDQPTITQGRFRQFYQCDFDIAGKYDAMIPDAEVLAIMQQILETVGVEQFEVKVNHRKILEMMIRQAGCSLEKFKPICSSIDKLDKVSWNQVKQQLTKAKGVTQQQAQIIGKLTCYKGKPFELLKKIQNQNPFLKTKQEITPYLQQMNKLFEYLQAMDRIGKVSFDLSLARGLDYYTGLIYQIVLTDKSTGLGSISGGGRYDDLIGMFCQYAIPSVGGSIGIQRIFTILQKQYKDKVKQNACEVLVATISNIPVKQKLKVLNKLWKSNIKAETLYVQKAKPDKQFSHAFSNGIPMILWLAEDELKNGQLNLKILYKNQQIKVPLQNVGQAVLPHVIQFRKDYELGNVQLKDPKKK